MWEMQTIGNVTRKLRKESGNSVRKLKKKMLDKFCISKYTKQVACRGES